MFKNIYVSKETAKTFGDAILVGEKGIKFSPERIANHEKEHAVVTKYFRDINGNAYIILHGLEFDINGETYGYLLFNDEPKTASWVYEELARIGWLKEDETLNIICCHGAGVREHNDNLIKKGENKTHPINFVNDSHDLIYCTANKMKTGKIRMSLGTKNNIKEKILYNIRSFF